MAPSIKERDKVDAQLDVAKLMTLSEPLTVNAAKIKGNMRQPVSLPAMSGDGLPINCVDESAPSGTNWTRNQVLELGNFVLNSWTGGGAYEFTATDRDGSRIAWQGLFDPKTFPEKIAPNALQASVYPQGGPIMAAPVSGPNPNPPIPSNAQPLGGTSWAPQYSNTGPLPTPHQQPQVQQPQPQMVQPPQPWVQQPPMSAWGQPQMNPWQQPTPWPNQWGAQPQQYSTSSRYESPDDRARRERDEREAKEAAMRATIEAEKRALETKLQAIELAHKETEYKASLERIQQQQASALQQQQAAHAHAMQQLQDEIRRIAETRGKGEDDEVRRLREEAAAQRERAIEQQATHQRQLMEAQIAQMRADSAAQMQMMRDQLTAMAAAPKGESDEYRALKAEQERMRMEADRRDRDAERVRQEHERALETARMTHERERERFEAERRAEAIQREMKEAAAATERRIEQLAAAQSSNQHNPLIDMIKETARASAENMREIARMQQSTTERMSTFMTSPIQLAQIMKDSNSGSDVMMRNLVDTVGGISAMYKNAAEQVLQMSSGPAESPVARILEGGLQSAKEAAADYMNMKRDQAVSEAKVKQEQVKAEAQRLQNESQLRAMQMQGQMQSNAQAHQRAGWAPPPPVTQGAPTNGAPTNGTPTNGAPTPAPAPTVTIKPVPDDREARTNGHPAAAGSLNGAEIVDAPPQQAIPANYNANNGGTPQPRVEDVSRTSGIQTLNNAPNEVDLFGMALASVQRLRASVKAGKLDPEKTVDAVLQAVNHIVSHQLAVPAFQLFMDARWADFIDLLLPDNYASHEFKAECIGIIVSQVEVKKPGASNGTPVAGDDNDILAAPVA